MLKKICAGSGCSKLVTVPEKYCEKCKAKVQQYNKQKDRHRGSSYERGYNNEWREHRARYLKEHPLCVECEKEGKLTPATVVDHIIPHKGDQKLFWDETNHQALCKRHHDRKTVKEDGGFGRPKGRQVSKKTSVFKSLQTLISKHFK